MLRKIARDQVRLGMFIHSFDGPWFDHPFWLPRFRLTDLRDLARIRDSAVPAIVIDEERGEPLDMSMPPCPPPEATQDSAGARVLPRSLLALQCARSFAEEQEYAIAMVRHSKREMKRLFAAAHAGEGLDLDAFTPMVAEVMTSIARNPYALIAITRLKKRDEYTYVHSLAVSALMTSFGRTLGMTEIEVFDLGLAGLLHDIGKMIVPDKILKKPDSLTDAEFALVRTHPEQGYLLLSQNAATPPVILDVCRHHHERLDGSGYPFNLKTDAISRAARIAAICDVYDALTSNRS
ncbi:HD-GYP domain-containing protein [Sphingomonas sp. GB1N7]|uniref:HD-GYP domain-containing protein n=1 Tax=Parasphingomonas caseinilytica TaxID=3096158 RepID=UPI002FC97569